MNVWTNCRPDKVTAKHLVHELILQARRGQIISVKGTIAAVRRDGPHLAETDCELVELIVMLPQPLACSSGSIFANNRLLNRADRGDTVSIKAALREAREAAPCLVASDEELTGAIDEAATAMGLCVAFDGRE
ncbi:hypothetical protein NKH61_19570 [Mesorhizobium sp. M1005]|uniref:hypothetical protein n=1 Tax=unclassified Mesorhizobium TaxID=325217 RepID=UPI00333A9963